MTEKLQIYIATHNRPQYIIECVNSVLKQDELINVEVIVSDNSSNYKTKDLISDHGLNVKYIKRNITLSAIDHFNKIINEADGEYLSIFHDDDLLLPSYVRRTRGLLEKSSDYYVAAAVNAFYINDELVSNEKIRKSAFDETIENQNILVRQYIGISSSNPPPFPGYMYRVKHLKNIFFDGAEGGKYCDLTFLIKTASLGKIYWISDPLMGYRIHPSNDTKKENINHRIRLSRFIYKATDIKRKSSEDIEMRFLNWMRWLKTKPTIDPKTKHRKKTVFKFVIGYILFSVPRSRKNWIKLFNKLVLNKIA
jgi:glycosyltransferase involved in cell wall biosynthesis